MHSSLVNLTFEIEVQPGEKLELPANLVNDLGPGRWLVTLRRVRKGYTQRIRAFDRFC